MSSFTGWNERVGWFDATLVVRRPRLCAVSFCHESLSLSLISPTRENVTGPEVLTRIAYLVVLVATLGTASASEHHKPSIQPTGSTVQSLRNIVFLFSRLLSSLVQFPIGAAPVLKRTRKCCCAAVSLSKAAFGTCPEKPTYPVSAPLQTPHIPQTPLDTTATYLGATNCTETHSHTPPNPPTIVLWVSCIIFRSMR